MLRQIIIPFLIASFASAALAADAVPARRLLPAINQDFYGADIRSIRETDLATCRAACLADPSCQAMTYNQRSHACFLKSGVERVEHFEGAVSAHIVERPAEERDRAVARAADLAFLPDELLSGARELAGKLGLWLAARTDAAPEDIRANARASEQAGDLAGAAREFAAAVLVTDSADDWQDLARIWLEMADQPRAREMEDQLSAAGLRADPAAAAINAYLRAANADEEAAALTLLARTLEARGEGPAMIPALRLAQDLAPGRETTDLLDYALSNYGFRIIDHMVDSEPASPRICVQFSEALADGVDYAPYLRITDHADLPVEADDQQLCVEGVEHGQSYRLLVREGLPSASGEKLRRTAEITAYVRDRSPSARFVGRAYVLPESARSTIPVVTVNTDRVELAIFRMGERSLADAIGDGLFGRAIGEWTETRLKEHLGEQLWSGRADVEERLNTDITTALPIGEAVNAFEPGVYIMTARVPGSGEPWEDAATQWFIVSDLGLSTTSGTDGVHVFARSLSDASAVEGAMARLIAKNNTVLGEAETDESGAAHFDARLASGIGGNAPALAVVEQDGDFAFLDLTEAPFDLSDRGVEGRAAPGPVDVFLTTERGVYRPGETVHATALARDALADAITSLPLTAVITRPDGVEYARAVLPDEGAGGRAWSVPLTDTAPRGSWNLRLYADPEAPSIASASFLVEDFVPERIAFDLRAPEGAVDPVNPPNVSMEVRYLYGAPGADLPVEGRTEVKAAEGIPGYKGFRFGIENEQIGSRTAKLPPITTDASGNASFLLSVPEGAPATSPLEVSTLVQVVDGSGRPVERSLTRPLVPERVLLGIRPLFDGVAEESSNADFQLVAVGPEGQVALENVAWMLSRINRQWQWYEVGGRWTYEPITSRERIASGTVDLEADARTAIEAPVQWGEYELKLATTGAEPAAASLSFTAGWHQGAGAAETPDMLEIGLDREAYAVGDEVEVRLKPRHAGKLLLAVADDRLIETRELDVEAGEQMVRLPVTEEWGAGAYVTATLIRPMDEEAGRNPSRALGLAWASVDPGARELEMRVTTPDHVPPQGHFEAAVQIDGATEGEQAHVTLAAVDLGILNLTGFEPPAPDDYYFGQRRLGIEMRDLYGRLIDGFAGTRGRLREGGDAAMARLKAAPPTEPLVAFFSGVVEVGEDGMARASFDLPDINGTVRVMAIGWTESAVGHAVKDVTVRDPVVVSAALPRLMAPGDESRLLIELNPVEGPVGEAEIAIESNDSVNIPSDQAVQTVTLEKDRIARLSLPIRAGEPGDAKLLIRTVTPAGEELLKTLTLPIRRNDPETLRREMTTLAPGDRLVVDSATFAPYRAGSGEATLGLGPLALFDVPGLMLALDQYPYGCTEQLASIAMPRLYLGDIAQALGLASDPDNDKRIREAIKGVLGNQTASGAFGLWRPNAGDFWLDAYITDFLSRAIAEGFEVPERAFRSALDNLASQLSYAGDFENGGEAVAYALMVLAREGRASIGDLRYYADAKAGDFATPMAKAQLGAALSYYGEQRRADAMFRLAASQAVEAGGEDRGWRADYGSHLRDAAALLALAAEARSNAVDRDGLSAMIARQAANRPTSPQEKAWLLMAAHAAMGEAAANVTLNGEPVTGPLVRLIDGADLDEGEMVIENTGASPLPAVLSVRGVPIEPEPQGGNGYAIQRSYFTMDGREVSPDHVAQNERLAVVLTVTPEADRKARLVIDDPLPAGFEIDNPNLLQSGSVAALDWLDLEEDVASAEFRSDRFIAALEHEGGRRIRLAYIIRAVSPGRFHHPAATVEDMYRPEFRAWTGTGEVAIEPAPR